MAQTYSITCNCGHTVTESDQRLAEAKQWAHAIRDHKDQVLMMDTAMIHGILTGWDKTFTAAK